MPLEFQKTPNYMNKEGKTCLVKKKEKKRMPYNIMCDVIKINLYLLVYYVGLANVI